MRARRGAARAAAPALAFALLAGIAACSKSDVDSAQRDAQNAIASAVPGLASALPEARADATIVTKIEGRFIEIDPASAFHVVIGPHGAGAVALSGSVRNADTEKRFIAAANGVAGVKSVTSTLVVDPTLPNVQQGAKDFALEAAVHAKLVEAAGTNGLRVTVTARSGAVTLAGDVPSQGVADTLVAAAKKAKGVASVASKLAVK
jgi:osmotically-inducible protein OsmY